MFVQRGVKQKRNLSRHHRIKLNTGDKLKTLKLPFSNRHLWSVLAIQIHRKYNFPVLSLKASHLFNWLRCPHNPHQCPLCIPYDLSMSSTNGELGPVEDWVTENNFKHPSLAVLTRIRGCVWYITIHTPSFWTCSQSCCIVKAELYL